MNAKLWVFLAVSGSLSGLVSAQQSLETAYRTTGSEVVAAFEPQRLVIQSSSAIILDGRKEIACGVVISPDGYILTKSSEVEQVKSLSVTVDRTKYSGAKIVAIDPIWDVALLKVEASGLVPVVYAESSDLPQGTWIVANGATTRTSRRILPGIISAKSREIPAAGGAVLGVIFKQESSKLEIEEITDGGGAKEAGLQPGDILVAVGDQETKELDDVLDALKDKKAGSFVKVTYLRGASKHTAQVRLAVRGELFEEVTRNDQMSGDYSRRRSGFPRVIQHDILGSAKTSGGPLLNMEGKCVGMNIARANRAESFGIPVEELKDIAARLLKEG